MVATATRPRQTSRGETNRQFTILALGTFTVGMDENSLIDQLVLGAKRLNINTATTGQLVTLFSHKTALQHQF